MKKRGFLITGLFVILVFVFIIFKTGYFVLEKDLKFTDIILSPDKNQMIRYGESFNLQLNGEKLNSRDSLIVMLDKDERIEFGGNYTITVPSDKLKMGPHFLDVTVWKKGHSKTVTLPFKVVSDILPTPSMFSVVRRISHDPEAYTQGLEWHNGILYESGGQYGQSLIRKVDPKTGKVIKSVDVPEEFFAEGLTVLNGKVYQLTWQEGIMLIYDEDLQILSKSGFRSATGEGWGMCNDGQSIIISDGSNILTWVDPEKLTPQKTIHVYAGQQEVNYLNELEYVDGFIYAHIYTTNQIARIEAATGKVLNVYEFDSLKKENTDGEVFNGVAYLPESGTFMVTGKNWKNMYEVRM